MDDQKWWELDVNEMIQELAAENVKRTVYITRITEHEKQTEQCKCGHLKRYHIPLDDGTLKCKYSQCQTKCSGFVARVKKEDI